MIKDQLGGFGRKAAADFKSFSPGQKAVTIVAVLALAIGGYLLATWTTPATYAPLYNNLSAQDASAISDKLASSGISYKLSNGGQTILVPSSSVDSARLKVSAAGLPNSGNTGYALLDKEGVTTSQFQQQVDYQRAVEGELAKTIMSISGIQAASVHLAIPQQDIYNDGTQQPTAAVLLTVGPGVSLTASQVQSVVYLVSSSVPSMKSSNVTVTDSNGDVLSAPGTGTSGVITADTQAKQTTDYGSRIAASLQTMLDQYLGAGHAQVYVNPTLDFTKTSTTKNSYLYNKNTPPVSQSSTKETYSGTGGSAAGTLGATDTTGAVGGSGNGKYAKTDVTVNNALGTVSQTTENAPGALQNLHIAVMVDKSVKNLNVAAISQLVSSGVGYNRARGDTLTVQPVAFDKSAQLQAAKAAKAVAAASAAAASKGQLTSMIKQGALAAIILALLIGTWLASRKRNKRDEDPDDEGLDLVDDLTGPSAAAPVEPQAPQFPAQGEAADAAQRRRLLVAAADNRPADLAHVLSGWLTTKENPGHE